MGMTFKKLKDEYYSSHDFKHLRDETKRHYQYLIDAVQKTTVDDVVLGDSVRIYKSDSDDAQYISSTVRVDPGSGFTSVYLSDTTGHGGWCGIPFVNCFN